MRYFYSDALSAYWMAHDHGMRFQREVDGQMTDLPLDFSSRGGYGRLYIHPESLCLLEPQAGDLVLLGSGDYNHAIYRPGMQGVRQIVQRNSRGFRTPECGE